jgi:hypothetical protein
MELLRKRKKYRAREEERDRAKEKCRQKQIVQKRNGEGKT